MNFDAQTYRTRRQTLRQSLSGGVVLMLGNQDSPINYRDNAYPFRQDSTFLYYFGGNKPDLAGWIDLDDDSDCLFGDDLTIDQIVWNGPQLTMAEQAESVGARPGGSLTQLADRVAQALRQGRRIHVPPPYRADTRRHLTHLLKRSGNEVEQHVSGDLIQAVIRQRSIKSDLEIAEIERALTLSKRMHEEAIRQSRPGRCEREVVGLIEGMALAQGVRTAFPTIFSVHGETLHNITHDNEMRAGQLVVHDSGVESPGHYASDISRTIPVSGKFNQPQREIYELVLLAQSQAIHACQPGALFREVHRLAAETMVAGMIDLGLMKGDAAAAVDAGAHGLFFPCGLGHMLGLDVHDMEALGEDHVGYTPSVQRDPRFGWRSLRLARALEPGFVVTVEPGIYFIPQLIQQWRAENRHREFIRYAEWDSYLDFGGLRVEDDILITAGGPKVLGTPIPKSISEIEALAATE